jgi:hypothetical protein
MTLTMTFRDIPPSVGLHAAAERWVSRLEKVHGGIVGCHVAIEQPPHVRGTPFLIRIALGLPGTQLLVSHQACKDGYVALADAFRAVRHKLLDHIAEQQPGLVQPAFTVRISSVAADKP